MRRYYAGIGARKTPAHIQSIMLSLAAVWARQGFILRTGGAKGADTAVKSLWSHHRYLQ